MKPQELSLNSEVLDKFREMFDWDLRYMVRSMKAKDLTEGTLTGKIKIILETDVDQNAELHDVLRIKPTVTMKLGMNTSDDIPETGKICLKFDRAGIPIIGDNQISMDEMLKEGKDGAA